MYSGAVAIDAVHSTALQGIDDLVFTVTRAVSLDSDLDVPVTLSSGDHRLRQAVAHRHHRCHRDLRRVEGAHQNLDPAAATGDVIATVDDGEQYDVPDPPTASVRVYVGRPLVTVRLNAVSYTVDDDGQGVTVSETGVLPVDEGATAAYTVVLDTEPTDDVTVTPQVQDASDAEISVSEALTFTMDNWHIPQTVIVTAAADNNRAHGSATISHTVAGGDYEARGVAAPSVSVAEVDAEGRTVVSLVHVPDGTVIPNNSTLSVGETVLDGSTFPEDERVLFRLLFSAADGGRARYGADVELTFQWSHESPIVPTSGELSRIVLSLPRADVWDSAAQILDNDVGNPDSTVVVRITGCERNGCVIGTPNEIIVTIADDDGGPAAAPPGRPQRRPQADRSDRRCCARTGATAPSTRVSR